MDNCNAKNIEQQVLENSLQIKKILQSLGSALPQPIAGPRGPQGATGERGPKGEEGVGIIGFGSELPLSARLGEWFIRSENDDEGLNYFFYCYKNYHWIRQFSVRGPKGVGGPAGGSEVIVNPEEEATDVLTKIKVDGVVYTISVPQDLCVDNMFTNDEIEFVDPNGDFGTNAKARIKASVGLNDNQKAAYTVFDKTSNFISEGNVELIGKFYNQNGVLSNNNSIVGFIFEYDSNITYEFNFTSYVTYWNENKEFLSGYIQGSLSTGLNSEKLKNIPDGTKFVRVTAFKDRLPWLEGYLGIKAVYANTTYYSYLLDPNYLIEGRNYKYKSILFGKKIVYFGDSWCAGNVDAPGGWAKQISALIGYSNYKNCGVHGSDWAQAYTKWFVSSDKDTLDDDYDYVIIEAYTNGLYGVVSSLSKQLGEINEFTYYNSIADIESALGDTYACDLEKFIYSCVEKWKNKKIALLFPYRAVAMNNQSNAFRAFREEVKKCCKKYGIPIMDNFDSSNIPNYNSTFVGIFFHNSDGIHLNKTGNDIISYKIMKFMETI